MNLLSDIITWIRRIVKTPSNQVLSDATIIDYINRFYTLDSPAELQLFELKTVYNLITSEYIDQYNLPYDSNGNLLYQNLISPVYCDGANIAMLTNMQTFLNAYPTFLINEVDAYGDNRDVAIPYTWTATNNPILRAHRDVLGDIAAANNQSVPASSITPGVWITAFDSNNYQMTVYDNGTFSATNGNVGNLVGDGSGTINYITGEVSVRFVRTVPTQNPIQFKYTAFEEGTPRICMFYNNVITLRPVPDTAYLVQFNAYITPSSFLSSSQALAFGYMAEWIARGAARKILSDLGDIDQFGFYEPLYKEQLNLVLRRTERQRSVERTSTIYTDINQQQPWNFTTSQGT